MKSKYSDPRWQKLRLKIMERDGWECVACGDSESTLNVHHKIYMQGEPWEVPDFVLQTLCENCHRGLGEHPKGGVWWSTDEDSVGFAWANCPICGGVDVKDKGGFDKCLDCGHSITPEMFPFPYRG